MRSYRDGLLYICGRPAMTSFTRWIYRTGTRTTDTEINELSAAENLVVITKDADFVNSFVLSRRPHKLLLVSAGNITDSELEALFVAHASSIAAAFESHSFIELNGNSLVIHR
jgi:predicted nuclease of predicted toxin-antitoxin system